MSLPAAFLEWMVLCSRLQCEEGTNHSYTETTVTLLHKFPRNLCGYKCVVRKSLVVQTQTIITYSIEEYCLLNFHRSYVVERGTHVDFRRCTRTVTTSRVTCRLKSLLRRLLNKIIWLLIATIGGSVSCNQSVTTQLPT